MVAASSHVPLYSLVESTQRVYGVRLSFVSARTIKRHHHHRHTSASAVRKGMRQSLPGATFSAFAMVWTCFLALFLFLLGLILLGGGSPYSMYASLVCPFSSWPHSCSSLKLPLFDASVPAVDAQALVVAIPHAFCPVLCCCCSCFLQLGPSRLFSEGVAYVVRPH